MDTPMPAALLSRAPPALLAITLLPLERRRALAVRHQLAAIARVEIPLTQGALQQLVSLALQDSPALVPLAMHCRAL